MVGNSGRYSKFQQRLRNIYLSWLKKKKKKKTVQNEFVEEKVKEIRRELGNTRIVNVNRTRKVSKRVIVIRDTKEFNNKKLEIKDKRLNREEVVINNNNKKIKVGNYQDKHLKNNDLDLVKVEIINKLKKKFIEKQAELELIESDLYFINKTIDSTVDTNEVKRLKLRIKELIDEINSIIEQYNLYNRNYDLSNVIGIDDNVLIDDIINYRNLLDNYKDKKSFVKEYKLLDEFRSLYTKLQTVKIETEKIDKNADMVINKYDIRDKKYNKVKEKFINIKNFNKEYLDEINKQNKSLDELMKKLSHINSQEYSTGRLVGFGDLMVQTLKFIGLKMLSPLSGFIPSIVSETIVTKNAIKGIYKGLHYEDVTHVMYSAVDYDRELNSRITDINYTEDLVDNTFNDLRKLKEDFMLIYDSKVPGYDNTLKNINKMEEVIYKNQHKVKVVKEKLLLSKKINSNKMIKVKRLNESVN